MRLCDTATGSYGSAYAMTGRNESETAYEHVQAELEALFAPGTCPAESERHLVRVSISPLLVRRMGREPVTLRLRREGLWRNGVDC